MNAALFADSGPTAGLGHLVRTCALAEGLRDLGLRVDAVCSPTDAGAAREVCRSFGMAWADADAAPIATVVSVDSYRPLPPSIARRFGAAAVRVEISDGLSDHTDADVVVDGAPGSEEHRYSGPRLATCLLGPRYALVPLAFSRPAAQRREGAVVSLGGSAPDAVLDEVARALRDRAWSVDAVIGPYSGWRGGEGIRVHRSLRPLEVASLFARAALGIVGGGQTVLQAVAAGLPSIAVVLAPNQRAQTAALLGRSALIGAVTPDGLRAELAELLRTAQATDDLAIGPHGIIDGNGPRRAAEAIRDVVLGRGA